MGIKVLDIIEKANLNISARLALVERAECSKDAFNSLFILREGITIDNWTIIPKIPEIC